MKEQQKEEKKEEKEHHMGYYDLPLPEPLLHRLLRVLFHLLRKRLRAHLPVFASVTFHRDACEPFCIAREPGFRSPLNEVLTPASTQVRMGPFIVTVAWSTRGNGNGAGAPVVDVVEA